MTEQEKQAVNSLINDLPHYSISDGTRRYIAMELAKKGYRKSEEVEKETAQKVINKIVRVFKDFNPREDCILTLYDVLNHIAYTAEEFGLEVD